MNCPNCQNLMNNVKIPSLNKGLFVIIDQCPTCGGIWCDRYEMYQIPSEEVKSLDLYDIGILNEPYFVKNGLNCPKDNQPLVRIEDVNIPRETYIMRCRRCEGVWLNCGELHKYKKHVDQRQKKIGQISEPSYKPIVTWEDLGHQQYYGGLSSVSEQLLPASRGGGSMLSNGSSPFYLSGEAVDLLKNVPKDKKIEIFKAMANEHNRTIEEENRFVNATSTILNIVWTIFRSLMR